MDEVLVLPIGGVWQTVGRGALRGITPTVTSVQADTGGSSRLEMTLRRDPAFPWPDISAFSDVDYLRDGMLVWSGRVRETPTRGARDQYEIAVSCEGWQAHLDDDLYHPFYVSTDQGRWRDLRDYLSTALTAFVATYQVSNTDGGITISLPKGSTITAFTKGGVMFDAGPGQTVQRIAGVVTHGDWEGTATLYAATGSSLPVSTGSASTLRNLGAAAGTSVAFGATFGTPGRYVLLFADQSGAATTDASWLRIDSIIVAQSTAYESSGASTLTADDVVIDALGSAPLLSTDTTSIDAASFVIPQYAPEGYVTPREAIESVNAFEGWRAMVDAQKRFVFAEYPTTAEVETLAELDDSAPTTVDDVTTRAIVETTDGAAVAVIGDRTTTATTLAGRRGVTRALAINPSSPMTQAGADRVADIWLAEHARAPMRGTITIRPGDCRTVIGGRPVQPSELLLRVGEQMRLARYRDPITGASHRDARIVDVDYSPRDNTARVSLDATRAQFDKLLSRYAAVVGR